MIESKLIYRTKPNSTFATICSKTESLCTACDRSHAHLMMNYSCLAVLLRRILRTQTRDWFINLEGRYSFFTVASAKPVVPDTRGRPFYSRDNLGPDSLVIVQSTCVCPVAMSLCFYVTHFQMQTC